MVRGASASRRQLSKVGSSGVRVEELAPAPAWSPCPPARFFCQTCLLRAEEGAGGGSAAFCSFLRQTQRLKPALGTPDFVPSKGELSSVNLEEVVVRFSLGVSRVCRERENSG